MFEKYLEIYLKLRQLPKITTRRTQRQLMVVRVRREGMEGYKRDKNPH